MKNKAREVRIFTPSFSTAFILTVVVVIGTYYPIAPMSSVLNLGEAIKERGTDKYGEPPYGHAELSSLKMFTKKEGLNLEKSLVLLRNAGLVVQDEKETLVFIAKNNRLTPQGVYEVIRPAQKDEKSTGKVKLPDHPAPGFGKKSLAEVCAEYHLNLHEIVKGLEGKGVKAGGEMSIKEIATLSEREPSELYEMVYSLVMEKDK